MALTLIQMWNVVECYSCSRKYIAQIFTAVPENILPPPTEKIGNSRGVGAQEPSKFKRGRSRVQILLPAARWICLRQPRIQLLSLPPTLLVMFNLYHICLLRAFEHIHMESARYKCLLLLLQARFLLPRARSGRVKSMLVNVDNRVNPVTFRHLDVCHTYLARCFCNCELYCFCWQIFVLQFVIIWMNNASSSTKTANIKHPRNCFAMYQTP